MRYYALTWALLLNPISCFQNFSQARKVGAISSEFLPSVPRRIQRPLRSTIHGSLSAEDQILTLWVLSFSASHIGMSALRDRIIKAFGTASSSAGLVGTGLSLPSYWPGDEAGNEVFPDEDTAGRQTYRFVYTAVSFLTIGYAIAEYFISMKASAPLDMSKNIQATWFFIAAASFSVSIASLFNASPMSLVPVFEGQNDLDDSIFRRNDSKKLEPRGLTRITRHPLILPVVPWGIATSQLAGGRVADIILFGGLAIYAICGCYAQDLRVLKKEGSVGTVFLPSSDESKENLDRFFRSTSFVPFGAVFDGRQSTDDIVREVPWLAIILGGVLGGIIQNILLHWFQGNF